MSDIENIKKASVKVIKHMNKLIELTRTCDEITGLEYYELNKIKDMFIDTTAYWGM